MYIKYIETVMNNFPKYKASVRNWFTLILTFKAEIISILYNLFQKIKAEAIIFNSFSEASVTLSPKLN